MSHSICYTCLQPLAGPLIALCSYQLCSVTHRTRAWLSSHEHSGTVSTVLEYDQEVLQPPYARCFCMKAKGDPEDPNTLTPYHLQTGKLNMCGTAGGLAYPDRGHSSTWQQCSTGQLVEPAASAAGSRSLATPAHATALNLRSTPARHKTGAWARASAH